MKVCNNEHIKENQRSIVPCLFCCHPGMSFNEIKTNGQTFQEALDIFKGTASPSIGYTMENIMTIQIVKLPTGCRDTNNQQQSSNIVGICPEAVVTSD